MANNKLFAIKPIFPPIILIFLATAIYYYIDTHNLFPDWLYAIYIVLKIFIALQIIIGSARSLMMPIVTLLAGILILFTIQIYDINLVSSVTAWQLLIMAVIGFVISIVIKL